MWTEILRGKIETRSARVSVIGLGYVGLSFAVELAKAGLVVRGTDLDCERVSLLNRGESYLVDVPSEALSGLKLTSVEPTPATIGAADCVLILTSHSKVDGAAIAEKARLVVDTRNLLWKYRQNHDSLVTL